MRRVDKGACVGFRKVKKKGGATLAGAVGTKKRTLAARRRTAAVGHRRNWHLLHSPTWKATAPAIPACSPLRRAYTPAHTPPQALPVSPGPPQPAHTLFLASSYRGKHDGVPTHVRARGRARPGRRPHPPRGRRPGDRCVRCVCEARVPGGCAWRCHPRPVRQEAGNSVVLRRRRGEDGPPCATTRKRANRTARSTHKTLPGVRQPAL
jgi:hypothetical protein